VTSPGSDVAPAKAGAQVRRWQLDVVRVINRVAPAKAGAQVQMAETRAYVYLLASKEYGTLYIGVTSNLVKRVLEHREHVVPGFTQEHDVTRLVWYECHESMEAAITREKQIKEWRRDWKINLIQAMNPEWRDLYDEVTK
jgi:putative endonuclease